MAASPDMHCEYEILLEKLRHLQKAWHKAAVQKALLEASAASTTAHGSVIDPIKQRLSELQSEIVVLNEQNKFLQLQLVDAKELYKRVCVESSVSAEEVANERRALEREYQQVMRLVDQFDPNLSEDAALVKAALAEQRVEIRALQDALEAVKRSMECDPLGGLQEHSEDLFVRPSSLVEVPMDDVTIPVANGKLRLLTGPRGDGLQRLRDRHRVAAFIVSLHDRVVVQVRGHKAGVENCVLDIRRTLSM